MVISVFGTEARVVAAIEAGATGCLLKDVSLTNPELKLDGTGLPDSCRSPAPVLGHLLTYAGTTRTPG